MRILIYILITLAMACSRESNAPTTPPATNNATTSAQPAPQTNTHIRKVEGPPVLDTDELVRVGDFVVTVADFERAVHLGSLFAPQAGEGKFENVPAESLAMPSVQYTTSHAILSRKVVAKEIKRRGITIPRADVEALYRKEPQYKGFVWLLDHPDERPDVLKRLNLTEDDFFGVGEDELARKQLADLLTEEVNDDELWSAWSFEHNTVSIAAVGTDNLPSSAEIDAFVEKEDALIQKFFNENTRRFRQPMRVIVDALVANETNKDKLDEAKQLLLDGKEVMEIALATGLEAQHSVRMIRQENSKAFHGEVGDVGVALSGPRGAYAWRVTGFEESELGELNRGLKREIAAELLRTSKPVPSIEKKMKKARRALKKIGNKPVPDRIDAARAAVSKLGLEMKVLPDFTYNPNGALPEYGLAPEVLDAAFKLSTKRPTSPLILSRERVYAIHLLERKTPDRKVFDAIKETWAATYRNQIRQTIVDRFVQNTTGNPAFNLRALAIKFGVTKKE
ncbi:MAG: peptidylprolyl isomerase [bacterium]